MCHILRFVTEFSPQCFTNLSDNGKIALCEGQIDLIDVIIGALHYHVYHSLRDLTPVCSHIFGHESPLNALITLIRSV
jgi:hypothetical protein